MFSSQDVNSDVSLSTVTKEDIETMKEGGATFPALNRKRFNQPRFQEPTTNKQFFELVEKEDDLFEYSRKGSDPGLLIIFNQQEFIDSNYRTGSDRDVLELIRSFQRIGFNVDQNYIYTDKDRSEVLNIIKDIAENEDLGRRNCLILVFLSHGDKQNVLKTRYGHVKVGEIIDPFRSSPYLKDKPKLFLFQACKGSEFTDVSTDNPIVCERLLPQNTFDIMDDSTVVDTIAAYATVEGKQSYRDNQEGTWFIQEFCRNLINYGKKEDVVSLITRTFKCISHSYYHIQDNQIVKQMPVFVSTLRKKFFIVRNKDRNFFVARTKTTIRTTPRNYKSA